MKIQNVTAAMRPMTKPPTPQELIAKADEDGDGALSKTEWQTITDKISLHHNVNLNAEELLTQYDEDEDGVLSDSEAHNALAGIADQLGIKPPPPSQELIAKADMDESGTLSKAEWQSITDEISQIHNISLNAEELLEQFDEDGDGVLSESEAQNALAGIADQLGLKPPPPPPPPEREGGTENDLLQQGIRVYQENAKLGED